MLTSRPTDQCRCEGTGYFWHGPRLPKGVAAGVQVPSPDPAQVLGTAQTKQMDDVRRLRREGTTMGKFDRMQKQAGPGATLTSPVRAVRRALTHEGGPAYSRDVKGELFLLAVTNMVGEATFYESAGARGERFRTLVHPATQEDADWVARFVPWLRGVANMRSASVVAAVEYVRAGGPFGRAVVASALQRADEPAEALAYFTSRYGRALPQPLKRGVADAARRLYGERAALKYDGLSRAWRMADVVELTHAKPRDEAQSALFRWLLDRRHDRADAASPAPMLSMLRARAELEALAVDERRALVSAAAVDATVADRLTAGGLAGGGAGGGGGGGGGA